MVDTCNRSHAPQVVSDKNLFIFGMNIYIQLSYRGTCGCVYVDNALHIRPCGINGRVEGEASRVDPEVGATAVHYLSL